jgi:hypothetical protein
MSISLYPALHYDSLWALSTHLYLSAICHWQVIATGCRYSEDLNLPVVSGHW